MIYPCRSFAHLCSLIISPKTYYPPFPNPISAWYTSQPGGGNTSNLPINSQEMKSSPAQHCFLIKTFKIMKYFLFFDYSAASQTCFWHRSLCLHHLFSPKRVLFAGHYVFLCFCQKHITAKNEQGARMGFRGGFLRGLVFIISDKNFVFR